MKPKIIFGFPVITSETVEEVLQKYNVLPWQKITDPVTLSQFENSKLNDEERLELRFAPRVEATQFLTPNKKRFRGFRTVGKHGTVVFVLLPENYVVVCAEFRHGVERVLLNLPGGLLDAESPVEGAKREFEEETGIELENIEQINQVGVPIIGRNTTATNFSFIGIPRKPVIAKTKKLDEDEFLETFVVPLSDWLTLATLGWIDSHSIVTTLLALKHLNRV